MKKLLLFAATLLSTYGFSQSLLLTHMDASVTVAANGTINAITTANNNTKVNVDVKNTAGTTNVYYAKRYDMTLNSGADAYFCFGGNCFTSLTTSSGNLTLTPGQSASQVAGQYNILTADLDEGSTVGMSVIKYTFYNVNTVADSVQITVRYNAPAGINETNNIVSSMELFPNPASDNVYLKVNSTKNADAKVMIYNSLGSAISEKNITLSEGKNKIDFNTESLSAGIYFVNIRTGKTTVTRKLVIK